MHEGEDSFASLSKGVFVIPFEPSSADAGPSRPPRPLKRVYDATYEAYQAAHDAYEADRTAEQLDNIHGWLERCSAPPVLQFPFPIHRLPVAVLQSTGEGLDTHLKEELPGSCTIHGREIADLGGATRAVAVGFMGEAVLASKKSGKTPLDEVEQWHKTSRRRDGRGELLLHVEQAQLLPGAVLAELLYVLSLHTELLIRVLLSVPSISTFMSSWTHVEPSALSVSVLSSGRSRKKQALIHALTRSKEVAVAPLKLSSDLIDDLAESETLGGTSSAGLLRMLKWNLLHHEFNSPLSQLAQQEDAAAVIQTILDASNDHTDIPGSDLLEIQSTPDANAALDPSPRISILHALSAAQAFVNTQSSFGEAAATNAASKRKLETGLSPRTPSRKRRKRIESPPPSPPSPHVASKEATMPLKDRKGDLKEMGTLINLWKSAGRNVNLWDWLEAFRITMGDDENTKVDAQNDIEPGSGDGPAGDDDQAGPEGDDDAGVTREKEEMDEETAARLHATFVRFCEEARMLGLVRARGKGSGRRGDEVAKGIGLV